MNAALSEASATPNARANANADVNVNANVNVIANASPTLRAVSPGSIIAARLTQLLEQANGLPALSADFLSSLKEVEQLASGLEPYLGSCTTPQSPELARLVEQTQSTDWKKRFSSGDTSLELESEMVSGHVEGQFLKMLVGAMQATRVLEIGLFTGYSALAMAEALPHHGKLVACEIDPFAASFAQAQFARTSHQHKISVLVGDALDSVRGLSNARESFDLIFIDADKAGYQAYLDIVLEGSLLATNGLICVDNTLMQGQPYMSGAPTANGLTIAAFNRSVSADPRIEHVMLPIRDGVSLIRRRG